MQDYLWDFPVDWAAGGFIEWEERRPYLVDYGLYEQPISEHLAELLSARHIDEGEFRLLVFSLVGIIWYSFYSASDDKGSLKSLGQVVKITAR